MSILSRTALCASETLANELEFSAFDEFTFWWRIFIYPQGVA